MKNEPIVTSVNKLTAVIVDDNNDALISLKLLLNKYCQEVEIKGEASSAKEAIKVINKEKPNVVFLDIELSDDTGFGVLEEVEDYEFQVIFVTAYRQYSIKAIRFSATDYLMKPVAVSELQSAVKRAKEKLAQMLINKERGEHDIWDGVGAYPIRELIIPDKKAYYNVSIMDIIRMQADGSYTKIILKDGSLIVSSNNLKYFQELLESEGFHRSHRSDLVSIRHIKVMKKHERKLVMEMKNGDMLKVAFRERKELTERLQKFGIKTPEEVKKKEKS